MHWDLFAPQPQPNVLPYDGEVQNYGLLLGGTRQMTIWIIFYSIYHGVLIK